MQIILGNKVSQIDNEFCVKPLLNIYAWMLAALLVHHAMYSVVVIHHIISLVLFNE